MNISNETISALRTTYKIAFFLGDTYDQVSPDKADTLSVLATLEGEFIGRSVKGTKKEMTLEYIEAKIGNCRAFVSLTDLLKGIAGNGCSVYPASYGIGVFVPYNGHRLDAIKAGIEKKLTDIGLQFRTEYSEAHYVLRYVISKSKTNLEKLL